MCSRHRLLVAAASLTLLAACADASRLAPDSTAGGDAAASRDAQDDETVGDASPAPDGALVDQTSEDGGQAADAGADSADAAAVDAAACNGHVPVCAGQTGGPGYSEVIDPVACAAAIAAALADAGSSTGIRCLDYCYAVNVGQVWCIPAPDGGQPSPSTGWTSGDSADGGTMTGPFVCYCSWA